MTRTAKEIMEERSVDDYMHWAIEHAGKYAPVRLPRWSYVATMFGTGSGVAQALCIKYDLDPDEYMGSDWFPDCPTCGTEHEE